jgi:hypothetical protein
MSVLCVFNRKEIEEVASKTSEPPASLKNLPPYHQSPANTRRPFTNHRAKLI